MHTSVNANLVAEIPEQDFYFVDIPNLVSGWPNGRSDVSPVRFRYGKLPLIRAACAVHDNLIKSLLRDCWSADRKRHAASPHLPKENMSFARCCRFFRYSNMRQLGHLSTHESERRF